jgi:hypothetical protein
VGGGGVKDREKRPGDGKDRGTWLARHGQIDWSWAVVDGSSVRAVFGGFKQVPTPLTERSSAASVM